MARMGAPEEDSSCTTDSFWYFAYSGNGSFRFIFRQLIGWFGGFLCFVFRYPPLFLGANPLAVFAIVNIQIL